MAGRAVRFWPGGHFEQFLKIVFGILAKIVAVQFLDFLILARKWSGLTCNRSRTAKVSHFEHPFDPKKDVLHSLEGFEVFGGQKQEIGFCVFGLSSGRKNVKNDEKWGFLRFLERFWTILGVLEVRKKVIFRPVFEKEKGA